MEQTTIYDILRNKALADSQRFVYPYVSTGKLDKQQLANWLTAFNRWLAYVGKTVTQERDYRRQFAAWFMRIDLKTDVPHQYEPSVQAAQGSIVNVEVKRQQPISKTVPLPIIFPEEQPKGKFSNGDNKFDMYWLKNLRDEVRSMGS